MKSLLVAAAVAATAVAAPASAASFTFNFANTAPNSTTSASGGLGNSFTYTQTVGGETLSVRISAFSVNSGVYTTAQLARYTGSAGGLGVTNASENGTSPGHTVDDVNGNDFLVFQFNKVVDPFQAAANAYSQGGETDNDMVAYFGNATQSWSTGFTAAQIGSGTGFNLTHLYAAANGGSNSPININPNDRTGNLLFIAAGGTDHLNDSLKLLSLNVATVPVPEPATWAMMIAGFGLVGAGMRRRSTTATRVVA